MCDLKQLFNDTFLCKLRRTVIDTADQIKSMEILQAKKFIENISVDQYGNTRGKLFLNNN